MSILITGVNGFIGGNLYTAYNFGRYLAKKIYNQSNAEPVYGISRSANYNNKNDLLEKMYKAYGIEPEYSYIDADITDLDRLSYVFEYTKPDLVIHCAANPIVKHDPKDHNGLINTNIIGTNNILHCMKPNTKIVFLSSIVLYDSLIANPDENASINPKSIYGASKYCCENIIKFYKDYKNIEYLIVRLGATVGKNTTHGLIHDIKRKLQTNSPKLELLNEEPGPRKPYTRVLDVCDDITQLILRNATGIFNVTNNDPISVKEVASIIMDKLNIHKEISWLNQNWVGDNNYLSANNSKIKNYIKREYKSSKEAIEECL